MESSIFAQFSSALTKYLGMEGVKDRAEAFLKFAQQAKKQSTFYIVRYNKHGFEIKDLKNKNHKK